MKKPLLVTHLVFAGLMSVGLTNDTASHNQHSTSADSPVHPISHGQAGQAGLINESRAEATGNAASSLSGSLSTTAEASIWGSGSCSPAPVEVKPCQ